MPLNVAGKQLSNGALAVAGGLVDTSLPWHGTAVARSAPQPATAPLSSHQVQSAPPPPPPPAI